MSAAAISIPISRAVSTRTVAFAAGFVVLASLLVWLLSPSAHDAAAPIAAPDFSVPSVFGGSDVALSARAGKPVVLNFFASWCIPCRRELPRFSEASKSHETISFIGIDDQDSRSQAQDLLTASGVTYSTGYDPKGAVGQKFGVTTGLPATVFIDEAGKIVHTTLGEVSDAELKLQLRQLVGER